MELEHNATHSSADVDAVHRVIAQIAESRGLPPSRCCRDATPAGCDCGREPSEVEQAMAAAWQKGGEA